MRGSPVLPRCCGVLSSLSSQGHGRWLVALCACNVLVAVIDILGGVGGGRHRVVGRGRRRRLTVVWLRVGCLAACGVEQTDSKVSIVMEQFLRMLHTVGLPVEDIDFVNCDGKAMQRILHHAKPRNTLFTGYVTNTHVTCMSCMHPTVSDNVCVRISNVWLLSLRSRVPGRPRAGAHASAKSCPRSCAAKLSWRTRALTGRCGGGTWW